MFYQWNTELFLSVLSCSFIFANDQNLIKNNLTSVTFIFILEKQPLSLIVYRYHILIYSVFTITTAKNVVLMVLMIVFAIRFACYFVVNVMMLLV